MFFPSKILLFGEYSLVVGGGGFAIPFEKYGGRLSFTDNQLEDGESYVSGQAKSNHSIRNLCEFLKGKKNYYRFLNLDKLSSDVDNGLWFASNIPDSYGVGSSGALIAALYHFYAAELDIGTEQTKERLASMENFFHGNSSGIDPLIAYYKEPALIDRGGVVVQLNGWKLQSMGLSVYLADTGIKSETKNLIHWFKKQYEGLDFREKAETHFWGLINKITHSMADDKAVDINDMLAVSQYQLDNLEPMIPSHFRRHFESGLRTGNFAFKLCGSGGGGYMLAFVENEKAFECYCSDNDIYTLKV